MKRLSMLFVGILVMMAFSLSASAQFLPGIAEITGFFGTTFGEPEETTAGAALTFNLTPRLGIEGEVGVIFTHDEIMNFNADLILNLGSGTSLIVPYFIGGAGIMNNGGTDIALNVGAGMKLFVEANIAIRTDFRGFFITESGDFHDMERAYIGLEFFF